MLWRWPKKQQRAARDWEEELQAHLAIEADQLRESGLAPADAESKSRQTFGNLTRIQEGLFEHGRWNSWHDFGRDLRHALRLIRRSPGFSALVILTLAVGIGASTAIFSLIHAVLLRPLPYKNPERLAVLWSENRAQNLREAKASLLNVRDWQQRNHSFEDITFYAPQTFLLSTSGPPERLRSARVPANFFPLLGIDPVLGRVFSSQEVHQGERVVVLSYALWQRDFAGLSNVIGQDLHMDSRVSKIIGVMPAGFQFPFADTQVWEPMTAHPYWAGNSKQPRSNGAWYVLGRLKPGVTWKTAQAEMNAVASRLREEHPENRSAPEIRLVPLTLQILGPFRLSLAVLFCAVFVILLIACINVASLLLARGSVREREFSLRRTLGAGSLQLAAQLLTETSVLATLGGIFGLLFAAFALKALIAYGPQDIPRLAETKIDGPVLLYAVFIAFFAAIFSGLAPAFKTHASAAASRTWTTVSARKLRHLLVIGEFALALVLLIGAGLLIRSFVLLQSVDPGFKPDHLLTMRIDLHVGKTASQQAAYFQQAVNRLQTIPNVRSAAAIGRFLHSYPSQPITIEGRQADASERDWRAADDLITGPYFETVGVPLKAGRVFSAADGPHSPLVAVTHSANVSLILTRTARRLLPGSRSSE